jgi:hypothetical protein
MENETYNIPYGIVPENLEGKPLDIQKSVEATSTATATVIFEAARTALLHPDTWEKLPGFTGASFQLKKAVSAEATADAELNDCIKIDIPGPGPKSGDGFDWVMVESLDDNFDADADASFSITVRPCALPDSKETAPAAHFFKDKATSTFIVKRKDKTVTTSYHGRNETPNLKGVNLPDKMRNSIVAAGALAGLSALQWTLLLDGLLAATTEQE